MENITKQASLDAGKALRPRHIADVVGKYMKEGNMEGILSMFHKDCIVYFAPNPALTQGLDLIEELFTPFVQAKGNLISDVTGELINGDTALLQANWRVESSDGSIIAQGSSTEVAKQKEDGSWVYYIDCPSGPPAA